MRVAYWIVKETLSKIWNAILIGIGFLVAVSLPGIPIAALDIAKAVYPQYSLYFYAGQIVVAGIALIAFFEVTENRNEGNSPNTYRGRVAHRWGESKAKWHTWYN